MANNNSVNLDIDNNSDGFDIGGGTTKRRFSLSGGDVSVSGSSGASGNTHTYPDYTSTLVGVTGSPSTGDTLIYNDSQWKAVAPTDSTGTDETAKVSSNDTTAGYLNGKLVAGDNITLTEGSDGSDETLTIASAPGWVAAGETWTYASDSTFTVSADVTDKYQKGDKIRWKQGGDFKYGHIASVAYSAPNTTVTIIENDDYSVANSAITDNYYSRNSNPFGFPASFSYTPTWTAKTGSPSLGNGVLNGTYVLNGAQVTAYIYLKWGSTTSSTGASNWRFAIPVERAVSDTGVIVAYMENAGVQGFVAGGTINSATTLQIAPVQADSTWAKLIFTNATRPFTWGSDDYLRITVSYIA